MIKKMGKAILFGMMEKNIKDNFKMTLEMGLEFINGPTETGIKYLSFLKFNNY